MRKTIAISSAGAILFLSAWIAPAHVSDTEVTPRDAKAIATAPITERNRKNVVLSIDVQPDSPKKLPKGFTILANNKLLNLLDDGVWPDGRAGDGTYSVGVRTKDGTPLKEKTLARITLDGDAHHATFPAPTIGCTFKRVKCPLNCRSLLFGSKCVVCFEIESCELSF